MKKKIICIYASTISRSRLVSNRLLLGATISRYFCLFRIYCFLNLLNLHVFYSIENQYFTPTFPCECTMNQYVKECNLVLLLLFYYYSNKHRLSCFVYHFIVLRILTHSAVAQFAYMVALAQIFISKYSRNEISHILERKSV